MEASECIEFFIRRLRISGVNLKACYLTGSVAGNYFIDGASDIDMSLFIDEDPSKKEAVRYNIKLIRDQVCELFQISLDLTIVYLINNKTLYGEGNYMREGIITSKYEGKLLFGIDILKDVEIPFESYLKETMAMPLEFFKRARKGAQIKFPLQYPDAKDFYFGYLEKRENKLSTKLLISIYTWIAAAIISKRLKIFVLGKRRCAELLKEIEKEKGEYLEVVYTSCRNNWRYLLPDTYYDIKLLRSFCSEAIKWENNYLEEYYQNN